MAHEDQADGIGLHNLCRPGLARTAQARGPWRGLGHRQDLGPRPGATAPVRAPSSRARFEGGQNPIHMRMRKLRSPNEKMSMPFKPFPTPARPVNLADLERRFDDGAAVDLDGCRAPGLGARQDHTGRDPRAGQLTKRLTVRAHGYSKSAASGSRPRAAPVRSSSPSQRGRDVSTCSTPSGSRTSGRSCCSPRLCSPCTDSGRSSPCRASNRRARHDLRTTPRAPNILGFLNLFTGGGLSRIAVFALGIMPYSRPRSSCSC